MIPKNSNQFFDKPMKSKLTIIVSVLWVKDASVVNGKLFIKEFDISIMSAIFSQAVHSLQGK